MSNNTANYAPSGHEPLASIWLIVATAGRFFLPAVFLNTKIAALRFESAPRIQMAVNLAAPHRRANARRWAVKAAQASERYDEAGADSIKRAKAAVAASS